MATEPDADADPDSTTDPDTPAIRPVSWAEVRDAVDRLAGEIESDGTDYGGIVSVNRGGLPIGVALSHRLDRPHGVIGLRSYEFGTTDRTRTRFEGLFVMHIPPGPVLLVDDIADTGRTIARAREELTGRFDPVDVAVMHEKPDLVPEAEPDYTAVYHDTGEWIEYPWECEIA